MVGGAEHITRFGRLRDVRRAIVVIRQPQRTGRRPELSAEEREWSARSDSSYCKYPPRSEERHGFLSCGHHYYVDTHHQRPVFPKRLFGVPFIALGPLPHAVCPLIGHHPYLPLAIPH